MNRESDIVEAVKHTESTCDGNVVALTSLFHVKAAHAVDRASLAFSFRI
jgi:hypothetical protein